MTNNTQMLPCPFCGGQATISNFPGAHNVWCENQPVKCGNRTMYTPEQWNTRAPAEDVRAATYDPAKENKLFEAWVRTKPNVSLRLCDIGLYYDRQVGLAHDAWQHRAKFAEDVSAMVDEPVAKVKDRPNPNAARPPVIMSGTGSPKVCECGPLRNITNGGHFAACTRCHRRIKP